MPRNIRDGRRQRTLDAGDPHLRRPGDAEIVSHGADLSRQPLRFADAAMDGELCLDRIGREALYETGESDD